MGGKARGARVVFVDLSRRSFSSLPRNHEIFRAFHKGLPKNEDLKIRENQKRLPATVLTFVEQEKWPQGTYSFVGMKIKGRLACVASPICAMGWGKDEFGAWIPPISFRIRESAENFDQELKMASFAGKTYEVTREDGLKDVIYSVEGQRPLWVQEPNGRWRIFKYYSGEEISNYAVFLCSAWNECFSIRLAQLIEITPQKMNDFSFPDPPEAKDLPWYRRIPSLYYWWIGALLYWA